MAEIIRSDGARVLIDDEDFERVSLHRWHPSGWKGRYVGTHVLRNGKQTTLYLHRFIVDAPAGVEVDHRNRDPLDNQRANLREVTHAENQQNTGIASNNTTGYRGVKINRDHTRSAPYRAAVQINGKSLHLGSYPTAEEAGEAAARGRALLMTHAPESGVPS